MESNKDEALKCLAIAQRRRNAGDFASARRFCEKSLSLFSTPEALKLLEVIDSDASSEPPESSSSSSASSAASNAEPFTSSAEPHPSASGARQRHTASSSQSAPKTNGSASGTSNAGPEQKKRDHTPEQAAVVKRVRSCKLTEYYEILAVKKDCEEADVKKAYRKVRGCAIRVPDVGLRLHL